MNFSYLMTNLIQIKFSSKLKELGFFLLWTKEGWRGWGGTLKAVLEFVKYPSAALMQRWCYYWNDF